MSADVCLIVQNCSCRRYKRRFHRLILLSSSVISVLTIAVVYLLQR